MEENGELGRRLHNTWRLYEIYGLDAFVYYYYYNYNVLLCMCYIYDICYIIMIITLDQIKLL